MINMQFIYRIVVLVVALLSAGCDAKDTKSTALGIVGYNYTDRYIHTFSVDGYGGGNIFLSSPTSGGGGTVCCVSLPDKALLPAKMKIEWTFGREEDDNGKITKPSESHTAVVMLNGPIPAEPKQFEVHFYPDGHVEVAVTDKRSTPRLKLESNEAGTKREQLPEFTAPVPSK